MFPTRGREWTFFFPPICCLLQAIDFTCLGQALVLAFSCPISDTWCFLLTNSLVSLNYSAAYFLLADLMSWKSLTVSINIKKSFLLSSILPGWQQVYQTLRKYIPKLIELLFQKKKSPLVVLNTLRQFTVFSSSYFQPWRPCRCWVVWILPFPLATSTLFLHVFSFWSHSLDYVFALQECSTDLTIQFLSLISLFIMLEYCIKRLLGSEPHWVWLWKKSVKVCICPEDIQAEWIRENRRYRYVT